MELKKKIMEEVNSISDETILSEIYQLLRIEKGIEYKLTEQEAQAVHEALDDIREGRIFTSQEANSIIKEWLKK